MYHDERDEAALLALAQQCYDHVLKYSRDVTAYQSFADGVQKKAIAQIGDEEPTLLHYKKQMSAVSNPQFSPAIYLEGLLDEVASNTNPIEHPSSLEEVFAFFDDVVLHQKKPSSRASIHIHNELNETKRKNQDKTFFNGEMIAHRVNHQLK